jgi:hypothetical protein
VKKNTAGQVINSEMVNSSDGLAFSGTVTVYVTGGSGSQTIGSVGSGICTSKGNGLFQYAPAQAETNYDLVAFTFVGTGAIPTTVQVFTIPATGILAPTVADRTLDVSAGGEAGVDWANVGTPGSTVSLSATTVATVTTATNLTNAPTSGDLTATMKTSVTTAATAATPIAASVSGAVGSVTGNVGGNVVGSVGSIGTGGIVAGSIGAAALNGKGDWNVGKTGYALTATTGLGNQTANITGTITTATNVTTVNGLAANVITAASIAADAVTEIQAGLATPTNITAASGIAVASIGNNVITAASLATDAVNEIVDQTWDELLSGHVISGSTGAGLSAAGGSGDPWSTALPGAYGAGTAGKIIGDNINATVSSRATQTSVDTIDDFLDTEIAAILADTNELQTDWADGGRLDLILDARASQTSLNTLDDYVDTEVAAIKAKTDQFVFTVANQVDANALTGGGGATAAAVADAVWDEILSGHAVAGSTGEALAAAGSAGDPWITPIPAAYAAGTAGYIVGTRIPTKTDLITSQSATMQTSPVRTLYITRGDSYSGATALTVAVTTNYTGYTPSFTIRHRATDAVLCTATPVVTSSTVLTVTLTTTNTAFADLLSDDEFGPHPWDIQLVSGSVQKTESGIAIVSKDQTRA